MKSFNMFIVLFSLFLFACNERTNQVQFSEVQISDLGNYKMKILPDILMSGYDVKLIIYDDCKYNKLNKVERNGSTIDIEKQFNSMIMAPCMLTNDTIPIGKLPAGTYRVNYTLVDLSTVTKNKTPFAIAFKIVVTN